MANFNKVILLGNLTRDPMLKYLPSGTPVVEIGLAVNRIRTDPNTGERKEVATFVDCRTVGKAAEIINQYCRKGRPLLVDGRLEYRSWDGKDGTKRSKLEVFIENFQFVGGRREEGGDREAPGRPEQTGAPLPARDAARSPMAPPPEDLGAEMSYGTGGGMGEGYDDDVPF